MFVLGDKDKTIYSYRMELLKEENRKFIETVKTSREYRALLFRNELLHANVWAVVHGILRRIVGKKRLKKTTSSDNLSANYFSNQRIAVYTCITGKYDVPKNPITTPNNVDYYIFVDSKENLSKISSAWKIRLISDIDIPKGLSAKETNRYIKMHPHIFFPEYKFSIYIDGNIKPITDFTEFIQCIDKDIGIATFKHPLRNCAYKECLVLALTRKSPLREIIRYVNYMKKNGFPHEYGLADCGIIVRRHNDTTCIEFMEKWWEQFGLIKRDQPAFSYVAYVMGMQMDKITLLGENAYNNYAFRRLPHFYKGE